jgi:hypothetical protein
MFGWIPYSQFNNVKETVPQRYGKMSHYITILLKGNG